MLFLKGSNEYGGRHSARSTAVDLHVLLSSDSTCTLKYYTYCTKNRLLTEYCRAQVSAIDLVVAKTGEQIDAKQFLNKDKYISLRSCHDHIEHRRYA